jgi:hypothetical protein
MSQNDYPQLRQLFGSYMHQDWSYEGREWPDLVRNFVQSETTVDPLAVAAEIERLSTEFPDDAALHNQVYSVFGCYYDPRPDLGGPNLREWLTQVGAFLRRGDR